MLRNVAVCLLLEIESSESDVARNKSVGCCTRSSLLIGDSVTRRSLLRWKLYRSALLRTAVRVELGNPINFIPFVALGFANRAMELEEAA